MKHLAIWIFVGLIWAEAFAQSTQSYYSFFVAGHTYGSPGNYHTGLHPPFKAKFPLIKAVRAEFGIFTGDIVRNSTAKEWDAVDKDLMDLDRTVYFAPGNHDLKNRSLFVNRYGPTYYSFVHCGDLFIILDPYKDGWSIMGAQLDFLRKTLQNNQGRVNHIFIFCHQLIWWDSNNKFKRLITNSKAGRKAPTNFWTEVMPLLNSTYTPTWVFAGDVGAINGKGRDSFMYDKIGKITLVASGMGNGKTDNFIIVNVLPNQTVAFRLIALNSPNIHSLGLLEDYTLP